MLDQIPTPAENVFRNTHNGIGHELVVIEESNACPGVERSAESFTRILSCKPCDIEIRLPLIRGIYTDPSRS